MLGKEIQFVCPELMYEKGLSLYLDVDRTNIWLQPDELHKDFLDQIVRAKDCFNFVVIGGSTGVTRENSSELSTKLHIIPLAVP